MAQVTALMVYGIPGQVLSFVAKSEAAATTPVALTLHSRSLALSLDSRALALTLWARDLGLSVDAKG
jgi:hypothetical protein